LPYVSFVQRCDLRRAFRSSVSTKGNVKTAMSRSPTVTQIETGASFEGFKIATFTICQLKSRIHFETDFGTGMQAVRSSWCFFTLRLVVRGRCLMHAWPKDNIVNTTLPVETQHCQRHTLVILSSQFRLGCNLNRKWGHCYYFSKPLVPVPGRTRTVLTIASSRG
jgi:hypothetical protein